MIGDSNNKTIEKEISRGNYFQWNYYWASVSNNDSREIIIKTGNKNFRLLAETQIMGSVLTEVYRTPDYSSIGTLENFSNFNDSYINLPLTKIYYDPTLNSGGASDLWYSRFGLGVNTNQVKSTPSISGKQRNFKSNMEYLVVITNKSGGTSGINLIIEGFEV
jgi:hypothetical protein